MSKYWHFLYLIFSYFRSITCYCRQNYVFLNYQRKIDEKQFQVIGLGFIAVYCFINSKYKKKSTHHFICLLFEQNATGRSQYPHNIPHNPPLSNNRAKIVKMCSSVWHFCPQFILIMEYLFAWPFDLYDANTCRT